MSVTFYATNHFWHHYPNLLVHVIFRKRRPFPAAVFRLVHTASVVSKIAFPTVRNSVTGRGGVEKVLTLNLTADEKALFESNRFSARLDRRPNASRRNPCSPQDDGNPTTIGTGQTIPCPATEATAHAPYVNHAIDGTTAARRLRRRLRA